MPNTSELYLDQRARVVELTAEGKRLAASCLDKQAKDLETMMAVLSDKEKEPLCTALKESWMRTNEITNAQVSTGFRRTPVSARLS